MIKKIIPLIIILLLSGCAVSHTYGPYTGTVVEKETGDPINGAVVFLQFYTFGLFGISQYEDAVEVMTSQKGEFHVPPVRVISRLPTLFSKWDPGQVIIFKPGYGAYPRHREVSPRFRPSGTLPENQAVTIKLPKLTTREERIDNAIGNLSLGSGVPPNKSILFERLKKEEFDWLDGN